MGDPMSKIAYDIKGAAKTASLSEHAIQLAIKERRLPVRDIDGAKIILRADMKVWLKGIKKS